MSGRRPKSFDFYLISIWTAAPCKCFCFVLATIFLKNFFFNQSHNVLNTCNWIIRPTLMMVRSCLRIDDEVVSKHGPMLRKSVTFNDTAQVRDDVTPLIVLPSSFTAQGLKTQLLPKWSSINNPYRRQKEHRVTFSLFCSVIETEGRCYKFPVALEEKSEYWKPGALNGESLYIMNFQRIWLFDFFLFCSVLRLLFLFYAKNFLFVSF